VPEFLCRVGAADGSVMEVRRVAASEDAVRKELSAEGLHLFSVSKLRRGFGLPFFQRKESVKTQDFLLFNTQLKTLLHAGLPLAQSLDLLKTQQSSEHFGKLLDKVHSQVTTGVALSDAFQGLGDVFPRLYSNSIRAGERAGELESVLGRYVEYQHMVENVRKKIIGALSYPAVLVVLSIGLIILLVAKVIPSFSDFYTGFGAELPLITRSVLGMSNFVQGHFLTLSFSVVVLFFLFRTWKETPRGRTAVDRWKLQIPLIGKLARHFALSQFTRSLAMLLGGGTPMVPALETAATSINNRWISSLISGCVQEVREGRALSEAVEDTGVVPEMALAMMRVGESTGALPEMLNHTSDFFDEEIEFTLGRLVSLFEPAILVTMGMIVAFLLLAVYYPLLTMVTKID